uniref:Uncharacterized protein n=1 Tax=Alexandrium catenella TaxID=2925 RepID=A0A6T9TDF0_ALECA
MTLWPIMSLHSRGLLFSTRISREGGLGLGVVDTAQSGRQMSTTRAGLEGRQLGQLLQAGQRVTKPVIGLGAPSLSPVDGTVKLPSRALKRGTSTSGGPGNGSRSTPRKMACDSREKSTWSKSSVVIPSASPGNMVAMS